MKAKSKEVFLDLANFLEAEGIEVCASYDDSFVHFSFGEDSVEILPSHGTGNELEDAYSNKSAAEQIREQVNEN